MNELEAVVVREIFDLYVEQRSAAYSGRTRSPVSVDPITHSGSDPITRSSDRVQPVTSDRVRPEQAIGPSGIRTQRWLLCAASTSAIAPRSAIARRTGICRKRASTASARTFSPSVRGCPPKSQRSPRKASVSWRQSPKSPAPPGAWSMSAYKKSATSSAGSKPASLWSNAR